MTLRTLAAVVLSIAVMWAWSYFLGPEPQPPGAADPATGGPAQMEATQGETDGNGTALGPPPRGGAAREADGAPADVDYPEIRGQERAEPTDIKTSRMHFTLDARGGRITSWELLEHERDPASEPSLPVDLVSPQSRALDNYPLSIRTGNPVLDATINKEAWYVVKELKPTSQELSERKLPEGTRRFDMDWADGEGVEVHKTLYLPPDSPYLARVEWRVLDKGQPVDGARISWGPGISAVVEARSGNRYAYLGRVVAELDGGLEHWEPGDVETDITWGTAEAPEWIALESQFFAAALIPKAKSPAAIVNYENLTEELKYQDLGVETGAGAFVLFAGPKSDQLLRRIDKEFGTALTSLVDWGFFGFIARPVYLLLAWLEGKVGNWGIAIIIVTIVIRILFFPLTQKAMISMRVTQQKMGKIQPKVHKIREKYKEKRDMESRGKMNQEMMDLYKREGVNPMSSLTGCLPLLLQLPVLYAMYTVLSVSIDLRGAPFFGWLQDLSAADPYYITPLVMGASMLIQQLMTMVKTEDPQQRRQHRMMLMMPLFFTFFFFQLPSGLVLYWLVNNILGIGQQVLINRRAETLVPAPADAGAKKKA